MTCVRACSSCLVALALAAGLALAPSCDGNGGIALLLALFTASQPSPGPDNVTMQAGTVVNDVFEVVVTATGVSDFFGAAFRMTYPSASVTFVTSDTAGSFLRDAPATSGDLFFSFSVVPAGSGINELWVTATRKQNAGGTMTGVDVVGSRELVSLSFRVTRVIGAPGADLTFGDPSHREVCTSAQDPGDNNECVPKVVTWAGGSVTASSQ